MEAVIIEFPGYVQNPRKVEEMLGGVNAITESLEENTEEPKTLQLSPRRAVNPFAHPIHGHWIPFTGFVCKIRRPQSRPESPFVEILAPIKKLCRFRELADFQVHYDLSSRIPQLVSGLQSFDTDVLRNFYPSAEEPAELPTVPFYTRIGVPADYHFHQFKASSKTGGTDNVSGPTEAPFKFDKVQFNKTQPVPAKPPKVLPPADARISKKLASLFRERPIWTRLALEHAIPDCSQVVMRNTLVHHAFIFNSGPWRQCWVRYGYDPSKHQEARMYQLVDIRSSMMERPKEYHWIRELRPLPEFTGEYMATIKRPIQAQMASWYQVCDIHHPLLEKLIHMDFGIRATCDEKDGFFLHKHFDAIRRTLKYFMLTLWSDEKLPKEGQVGLKFTEEEYKVLEKRLIEYVTIEKPTKAVSESSKIDKRLQQFMNQLSEISPALGAADDKEYNLLEEDDDSN